MICQKKLRPILNVLSLFSRKINIALFGMSTLYAENQIDNQYVSSNLQVIHEYEQLGDYANALKIARSSYEETLKRGLTQEAENFSQIIPSLEEKHLNLGSSRLLFNENFQPKPKLLQLLQLAGMETLKESEKNILHINTWAQKNLLRQAERWEEQNNKFEELKPIIKPILEDLGFVDGTTAHFKDYQGAIVHGGLLQRARLRLHYLIEQWQQGVRFTHLYFLTGERPLEPLYENRNTFIQDEECLLKIKTDWQEPLELPKTESEMMQLVWEQSEIPEDMVNQVIVHFIKAPMKKDPKSEKLLRPTTDDTVEAWLKDSPPHGRYLAITNAPYINRQDLVTRTIASDGYCFDTVGSGSTENERMAIYLDEVARLIFQAKQFAGK